MFRTATAFAVAALFCAPALAQSVTAGQYYGVTQYTGLLDPNGICGGLGLAAGENTSVVATVKGLGTAWSTVIANSNPGPGTPYGVSWINCAYSALPAATAFTQNAFTGYDAQPATSSTACTTTVAGTYTGYSLSSANGTNSVTFVDPYTGVKTTQSVAQTLDVSILPVGGGFIPPGAGSSFKVTTTNTVLALSGAPLCGLSTDALYMIAN